MVRQKPKVGSARNFSRFDKLTGYRRHFLPKNDEIVVTFDPRSARQVVGALVDGLSLQIIGVDVEKGFTVCKIPFYEGRDEVLLRVLGVPGVWNVMTAMFEGDHVVYILPDEVTVQFRRHLDESAMVAKIRELNSFVVRRQRSGWFYTVAVPEGSDVFSTIDQFCAFSDVLFAEFSEVWLHSAIAQGEQFFDQLWGLFNHGQTVNGYAGTSGADVKALDAWTTTKGNTDVILAIIDSGADLDHSDLASSILPRLGQDWDFSSVNSDVPEDGNGHGTHVAGIACAVENGTGIIGLAPSCSLMPLKINLNCGLCQDRSDAISYVAGLAAANKGKRYILNLSWGSYSDNNNVKDAISGALVANTVIVAGVGNDGYSIDRFPFYPASYPGVAAVAATDPRDVKCSCSNFGARVDVAAPGLNIYSTHLTGGYAFSSGTSCAAPYVSALAGLIWSKNSGLANWEVVGKIKNGADRIEHLNTGFINMLGAGRINAFRSLSITP